MELLPARVLYIRKDKINLQMLFGLFCYRTCADLSIWPSLGSRAGRVQANCVLLGGLPVQWPLRGAVRSTGVVDTSMISDHTNR